MGADVGESDGELVSVGDGGASFGEEWAVDEEPGVGFDGVADSDVALAVFDLQLDPRILERPDGAGVEHEPGAGDAVEHDVVGDGDAPDLEVGDVACRQWCPGFPRAGWATIECRPLDRTVRVVVDDEFVVHGLACSTRAAASSARVCPSTISSAARRSTARRSRTGAHSQQTLARLPSGKVRDRVCWSPMPGLRTFRQQAHV